MIWFGKVIWQKLLGGQERIKRSGRPGNRPQALHKREGKELPWQSRSQDSMLPTAGGAGSILGQGTKISHAMWQGQKGGGREGRKEAYGQQGHERGGIHCDITERLDSTALFPTLWDTHFYLRGNGIFAVHSSKQIFIGYTLCARHIASNRYTADKHHALKELYFWEKAESKEAKKTHVRQC